MRVQLYNESLKPVWDDFVRCSKNGTFLFFRDYMDYHRDRFADHSLLIWDDKQRLIALLPANKRDNKLASHGGLTYGGFITDETMKTPLMLAVFEETIKYLRQNSFTGLMYKTIPYIYAKIPAEEDRYALFLDNARLIRRGVISVIANSRRPEFQERRMRGVKKASANGLCVELSEDWNGYWKVLSETICNTYQTQPVHSLDEIKRLYARFPENIKLFACFRQTDLLGGVVIYETDLVARTQYIAAGEQGKELGALDMVFHYLLNEVYSQKPFFEFGTSDEDNGRRLNKGLIDQKEGFGARTIVHDHYEIKIG
jgi:hypothetical protein